MPTTPTSSSVAAMAVQAVRGFCMGMADIVPGVSGGTVALVFGIYPRLVANIRKGAGSLARLLRGDVAGFVEEIRNVEWAFLLPLLAGIGTAFVALSHLIETLLHDHPEKMAGLFLGLVVASVFIAARLVRSWSPTNLVVAAAVTVVVFLVLGIQGGSISDPSPLQLLGAGAIAICAMILPGISGSFLLLMLGMYSALLSAVTDRELFDVGVFLVGAVVGLALFSTLLSWLLTYHHDLVLAALIGLMAGSVRVLWPWPNGVGVISDVDEELVSGTGLDWPASFSSFLWPTVLAVVAASAVVGLAVIGERRAASLERRG